MALEKDGSRAEYRDTIGSMLEEVNRLTALVDNLLTIARADAGRIALHPTMFSAVGLAREAAGLLDVLAEEKDQRITVQGDERITLNGDRVFLRQALVNIIHNAVKHSPVGGRDFRECPRSSRWEGSAWKSRTADRASRRSIRRKSSIAFIAPMSPGRAKEAAPDWDSPSRNGPCGCMAAGFN